MGGGGGAQCCLSILRNGNVPCLYFRNFPVDFKIAYCRLSIKKKKAMSLLLVLKCSCRF